MHAHAGPIKTLIWEKAAHPQAQASIGDWHAYDDTDYQPALEQTKLYLDKYNATPGNLAEPERVAKTVWKASACMRGRHTNRWDAASF